MTQDADLKQIERRAYVSYFQDGLWGIFIGLVAAAWAVGPLLSDLGLSDIWSGVIFLPFVAVAYAIFWAGKRFVTRPRMGLVRFGPKRKARLTKILAVTAALLTVGLVVGIVASMSSTTSGWVYPAALSAVLLVGFSVGAYFLDFPRLYLYGALLALCFPVGEVLFRYAGVAHHGWPITFGVSAVTMLLIGVTLFAQFVRKYPSPVEGDFDANN
jgi:hypothetical protein